MNPILKGIFIGFGIVLAILLLIAICYLFIIGGEIIYNQFGLGGLVGYGVFLITISFPREFKS